MDPFEINGDNSQKMSTKDDSLTSKLLHHQLFDLLEFSEPDRLKAIERLTRIAREDHKTESSSSSTTTTFTDEDMVAPIAHGRPLYVTAEINGVSLPRALIDNGTSVNVMPISTFELCKIPNTCLVKEATTLTEVLDIGTIVGHVTVSLEVGEIKCDTLFHVVETNSAAAAAVAVVAFHVILGREWIHQHQGVPSTLHQCFKGEFQGKEVVIKASQNPFDSEEMDLPDASLYK